MGVPGVPCLLWAAFWIPVCLSPTASAPPLTVYHLPQLHMGLCNQLHGFFGYVLDAHTAAANGTAPVALTLPAFTTSIPESSYPLTTLPFRALFQETLFADGMRRVGLTVLNLTDAPKGSQVRHYGWGAAWQTWRRFEGQAGATAVKDAASASAPDLLDTFNVAMAPVLRIKQCARIAAAALGTRYGCLHARIERDMKKAKVGGLPPPGLPAMLRHMGAHPALRSPGRIFVAVGSRISADEDRQLARPLPWNATLVRKGDLPAVQRCIANLTYAERALVDLTICRAAVWFVGYSGSTFSLKVAQYRHADHRDGWWSACDWGITLRRDRGLIPHLCRSPP